MRKSGGGIIVPVFWLNPDKWDDWNGSQEASQILCQAKKREMVGGGGILCHEWNFKKKITMVLHSVSTGRMHSSTDSSLWAAAGRGLCQGWVGCQGGGWRRDRASGEPQTTTDGATHSSLSSTPNQPTAQAAGCLAGHTLTGETEERVRMAFVLKQYPSPRPQRGIQHFLHRWNVDDCEFEMQSSSNYST